MAAVRHRPHLEDSPFSPLPFASREDYTPLRFPFSPIPKTLSPSSPSHVSVRSLFTGIVEDVDHVRRISAPSVPSGGGGGDAPRVDLMVETKNLLTGTQLGDSVAVDRTCLTVAAINPAASTLTFGVALETLQ